MIPVAALLILLVALLTLAVAINNNSPVAVNPNGTIDLSIFGARVAVNEIGLFCTGAVAMLVLVVAFVLLRGGLRRARISRRERKNLINAASGQATVARKEPSSQVLPGRGGTVRKPDPSSPAPPTSHTDAERPTGTRSSTDAGQASASRSETSSTESSSTRLQVPPMKSPDPER